MIYIDFRLTIYALAPMPFLVISARYFSRKMHRKYQSVQASFGHMTEVIREKFAGIRVVKASTLEEMAYEDVKRASLDYVDKNISLTRITGSFFPLMMLFTNMSLAIVLYFGGIDTIFSRITTGDFVAFINYLNLMTWPMMAVGWVISMIQRGKASLDRINKVIETIPVIQEVSEGSPLGTPPDLIRFDGVSFSYETETPSYHALSEINISIMKNSLTGITGPPGSGKTTLLRLIPRLFDPTEGAIFFDGEDIRSIRRNDLRAFISFVSQEPFLFSGTIAENITFSPYDSQDKKLLASAKSACVYETILSFQNGFETLVGERGVVLSGGQKQRIAIARALYHDGPILILDDPVSQVDAETGEKIMENIRKEAHRKTVVIVSHRLSLLKETTQIIVMENGGIAETGSPLSLSTTNGYYQKIAALQSLEEEHP